MIRMQKGGLDMKLLKIEGDLGYYLNNEGNYSKIDTITKEDLMRLADLTLEKDVEFDENHDEGIKNPAHQIVYKSILKNLKGLENRKQEFKDEVSRLYLSDYEKYQNQSS